jgi:large subunit ribosomal protein L17
MLRHLVRELFVHGRITTTPARAKEARRIAERLITLAKRGGLARRRRIQSFLQDERVTRKVWVHLAQRFRERPGGYTRIIRYGGSRWDGDGRGRFAMRRLGDAAQRVIFELVERKDHEQELYEAGRGKRARDERIIERRARKERARTAASPR